MNIKINTTLTIKIAGEELILSKEEAIELYMVLKSELGMDSFTNPFPYNTPYNAPYSNPNIVTCDTVCG